MSYELTQAPAPFAPAPERTSTAAPRVWPVLLILAVYWAVSLALRWTEQPMFVQFMSMLATRGLLILLFVVWWLAASRVSWTVKFAALGVWFLGAAIGAALIGDPYAAFGWLFFTLPWALTIWGIWIAFARRLPAGLRSGGLLAALVLTWIGFSLVITDGLWGDGQTQLRWRWIAASHDSYLDDIAAQGTQAPLSTQTPLLKLQPGDWPGFRGPERNSRARGLKVAADWNASPPRQLWSRRIGDGW